MKLVNLLIKNRNGESFEIKFKPLSEEGVNKDPNESKSYCYLKCPYSNICDRLPNPIRPKDKESSFLEFCSDLDGYKDLDMDNNIIFDNKKNLEEYCPVEGSLEKIYPDLFENIYKQVLSENPLVRLNDLIDSVCKDVCPLYRSDHSKCTSKNELCLLKNFIKLNKNE